MTTYVDKPVSLLERKKRQWAQEKDELEHLWVPWGNKQYYNSNSNVERDQHNCKLSAHSYPRKEVSSKDPNRKNSLPPLNKNLYNSNEKFEKGSETSGYASDNPNHSSEYLLPQSRWSNQTQNQSGYESSSSRDDRPKWKDKVKPSEELWEGAKNCDDNFSGNEPPNWLKRGLEHNGHIEVTNSSPSESPEQEYTETDRPLTSSSSTGNRTYIRGQNVHLDALELAEREQRRKVALQHQEDIRKQLEEREKRRLEERKRRIQEEYEEELRIAREQEIENKRREHEYKFLQEKQKKDEERKEAIKEAIEIAEKEARLQKTKLKMMKQQNNENCDISNENVKKKCSEYTVCNKRNSANIKNNIEGTNSTPKNINIPHSKMNNNDNDEEKENLNNSSLSKIDMRNANLCIKNNLDLPSCSHDVPKSSIDTNNVSVKNLPNQKCEPIALVIPSNPETLQHFQYAVLMPVPSSNSIPIAIPLSVASKKNHSNVVSTGRTENRILTPTQYRLQNKFLCDSSTQTDDIKGEKFNKEKNNNLDANYDTRSRKGRSSSRNEIVSDRPKWGANRPPTRYLKQSEKDPLYQRKKLRQRIQENLYDDKNSSDESQTGTPRFRKKVYMGKRAIRPLWRKYDHDEIFSRNIRMYQSEIVPIRPDKDHVCFEHRCCCSCRCIGEYTDDSKVDILTINHNSSKNEEDIVTTSIDGNLIEDRNRMIESLPPVQIDMLKQEQCSSPRILSSISNGNNF